jgi:hypothetical protein
MRIHQLQPNDILLDAYTYRNCGGSGTDTGIRF